MPAHAPVNATTLFRKPEGRLVTFFVAALAGTILLLAFVLGEVYKQAGRQAETDARNVVGVLETRLDATLRRIHADLEYLAGSVPLEALAPDVDSSFRPLLERQLTLHAARFPEIVGYRVADASGAIRYASQGGLSQMQIGEREYFLSLRNDPGLALAFSDVFTGRLSGRGILIVAVPVRDSGGTFRGAVLAPLDLAHLQRIFDAVDLGPNGVITLRRSDNGRLALRRPGRPEAVNQTLKDNPMHMRIEAGDQFGSIRYRAALDGIERLYAYRRVNSYPFYVAVGIASEDYLASWRTMVVVAAALALLLILALSLVLIRLLRVEREELAVSARLGESEARYRLLADNSHDVIWTVDLASRRFTYVSPSVLALRGYSVAEVLGQTLEESLAPRSAEFLEQEMARSLQRIAQGDQTAQVLTCELEQLARDGRGISTEVVLNYLLGADGVPRTILGITRNVSERKRAEQALRESNQQLQARLDEIGRLQAALQEQAVRDGLTALYNRRYLDEMLEREVSRAKREAGPLSLVMLDIDHFKRVNDTYGHQAGDEVLRVLAATLMADIRAEDMACRYGGEEFLILLPNMPLSSAEMRAEVWRQAVESLSVVHGECTIRFTISLGVAAFPEHGKTPDELTRSVDLALYRAKMAGRNRVVVYTG
ncbi:MAG: diguanylate cyclase [Dechloromonas sp.]|nr:MAG: diguanylate cyclase [Dechloromonas sp.]